MVAYDKGPVEERTISPTILPSPAEVVQSIPELFRRDWFITPWPA
jgi:hypothetical protein